MDVRRFATLLVPGLVLAGCVGFVGEDLSGEDRSGGDRSGGIDPGRPGLEAPEDRPGGATVPTTATVEARSACDKGVTLGISPLRRLTATEYARTVRDLLSLPATSVVGGSLPSEGRVDGFANNTSVQTLTGKHLGAYVDSAEQLTAALLADPKRRDAVFGCSPTGAGRAACTRAFITRFGRRAFRRPLTTAEVDQLAALAAASDKDPDPYAGLEHVIQATLTSTNFLFLVELGTPDPKRAGYVGLRGHELAARLSLFLWGMGPNDALLDLATAGKLNTPDELAAMARTMMADPRAAAARRDFHTGWLGTEQLAQVTPDAQLYPKFNAELRAAFEEETSRFVDELLTAQDQSLLDLTTATFTFVNAPLARHYGLTPPASGWVRHEFTGDERGAGFLTHASFLTMTAPHPGIEPIKRGQLVRELLLCERLPPPPPGVPALDDTKVSPAANERERLAAHRKDPSCDGCHTLLDPVGFGLSQYDGVGVFRTQDLGGNAIDARGTVFGLANADFEGPRQLGALLRGSGRVSRCAATQLFRYVAARTESPADECALALIHDAFAAGGYTFPALVEAVVRSDAFRFRRLPGGTP